MLKPFTPLSSDERREQLAAYRRYLELRDGALDVANQRLSRREESMGRYTRPARTFPLDRELFDAQYEAFDPARPTPELVKLLLALVKINAAEAYGVKTLMPALSEHLAHRGATEDDTELVLMVEETYHTRILSSSTCLFGFEIDKPFTPTFSIRTLIAMLGAVPKRLSRPLLLASELVGVIFFTKLFVRVRELVRDAELRDAIEERLLDVIVDEIGHVTFNRLTLGSLGLSEARVLTPMVANGMRNALPDLEAIGVQPSARLDSIEALPEEVWRKAFVV